MSSANYCPSASMSVDSAEVTRSEPISIMATSGAVSEAKMPIVNRRRRPLLKLSSSPVETVDAQGTAYLCFPQDHSWFQGNISTEDESNYSLYGERISVVDNNNKEDKTDGDDASSETGYYRVTMIDHFSGQKYILPKIASRKEGSTPAPSVGHRFTSQHGEVSFEIEHAYRGQKADIMIHKFIGSPSLLGKKCNLYSGQINILFNDVGPGMRSWSL